MTRDRDEGLEADLKFLRKYGNEDEDEGAYEPTDPKHQDFHDTMADLADRED